MYDLHNLGWNSFQDLCVTVTREVLGQTVQSFLPSRDGGRDGAFSGTWKRQGGEDLKGRFVIQCKFTGKSDYIIKVSDLTDEVEKVRASGSEEALRHLRAHHERRPVRDRRRRD